MGTRIRPAGVSPALAAATYVARTTDAGRRDALTTAIDIFDRKLAAVSASTVSGYLRITYFTAPRSLTVSTLTVATAGTAAGATPTLIRFGLYSATDAGVLSAELATTANDTALLASTSTLYSKSLSSSVSLVEGTRYAVGILVVTGATAPTLAGCAPASSVTGMAGLTPQVAMLTTSLSDLPSSFPFTPASPTSSFAWARLS